MKDVKLVLSVVAMVEDDKGKLVYQTEKIYGAAKIGVTSEAHLVGELIAAASSGVSMKPDSVKKFKADLEVKEMPKAEKPPAPPADEDRGGGGGGRKKAAAMKKKAGAAKKKSSRGRT